MKKMRMNIGVINGISCNLSIFIALVFVCNVKTLCYFIPLALGQGRLSLYWGLRGWKIP